MLPKWTRLLLKTALILSGVFLTVLLVLQIALNSRAVDKLVRKVGTEYIDGELQYSKLHFSFIKRFPTLRLTVDTLSLTYPHSRFSGLVRNPFAEAGCGADMDTLARFDRFVATVNVWRLLSSEIRLSDASLEGLRVYAHSYSDTVANWMMFRSAPDSSSSETGVSFTALPEFSIGDISIRDAGLLYSDRTDAYSLAVDRLKAGTPEPNSFDLSLFARGAAMTGELGRLFIPLELHTKVNLSGTDSTALVLVPELKARIAGIPLNANGEYELLPSENRIKAEVSIDSCLVRPLIDDYAVKFYPGIAGLVDKGLLSLNARAEGPIGAGKLPEVNADAVLTALGSGAALTLDADAVDLLGKSLRVKLALDGDASLNALAFLIPDSLNVAVDGRVALSLDADVSRRDLETMKFRSSTINGRISSPMIRFSMDSLSTDLSRPSVGISAKPSGLDLRVNADTVSAVYGEGIRARLRGMTNELLLTKVEKRGTLRPRISLHNTEKSVFIRSGNDKIGVRGLDMSAAATRRSKNAAKRKKTVADSLILKTQGPSSDEELSLSLDSSVTRFLNDWKPEASISFGRAFVSTPSFPLRTRISLFKGVFDGNVLSLDTLALTSGSSDLEMKGEIKGLRRLLRGRRGMISANVELDSKYLNANELIAAASIEKDSTLVVGEGENDESFVTDTLKNANLDSVIKRSPLVPSNLDLSLKLRADSLDYSDLHIKPIRVGFAVRNQTLQLSRAMMRSNLGDIFLSAFYSTKSPSDISAGLDLRLQDISAEGIIHMLPTVDEILPALKSFQGDLNCDLSLTGKVDSCMNLIMPSLDGVLKIGGENLYIADAGDLKRITRLLLFKNKDIGEIQNMSVSGIIHDNKLEVYPFELDVDRYKLALQGIQGFDNKMDYHISVMKSPLLIPFGIRLFGDGGKWRFRLTSAKYRSGHVPAYTETLDTVRVNIRKSIMDIFRVGASKARTQNAMIAQKAAEIVSSSNNDAELGEKEQAALDAAMMAAEIEEQTKAIEDEANAVLKKHQFNINSEAFRREMEESRAARKAARNAERQKTRKK